VRADGSEALGVPAAGALNAHPLGRMLLAAAAGRFPPLDGRTEVVPSPPGRSDAVVGFTAHHVVAADIAREEVLARLPPGDIGATMDVRFLAWLGERLRSASGMVDAVLVADALEGEPAGTGLVEVTAVSHPRVERAARYRTDLRTFVDERRGAVLTIGRGLAGRLEVSVEVDPAHRDVGLGRHMAETARTLAPPAEPLFAQVTPGNAASLRAFLAAGYRPIGSEVLFLRAP
jgi:GNAT superfamily N-acetyltransferase